MKEPRRWLDSSRPTLESRLLRAAVEEPLPGGAIERAGKRFGVSAALLGASSASAAKAAAASSAALSAKAGATATLGATGVLSATGVLGSTALVATVAKSIVIGVGVGAVLTGVVHWAATSQTVSSGSSPTSVTAPRASDSAAAPRPLRAGRGKPDTPATPAPLDLTPSGSVLPGPGAGRATETASEVERSREGSDAPAQARFDDPSSAPDALGPAAAPVRTALALTDGKSRAEDSALAREVRLLDDVRLALRQGDPARALGQLDQGRERGLIRLMDHEASLLRFEALASAGRNAEAQVLARRLLVRGVSPSQREALEAWLESSKQ